MLGTDDQQMAIRQRRLIGGGEYARMWPLYRAFPTLETDRKVREAEINNTVNS